MGCSWVEMPKGKYLLRGAQGSKKWCNPAPQRSRCQIELDISWENVISYPVEGEWLKIAPIRILSFDIECAGRKGQFRLLIYSFSVAFVRQRSSGESFLPEVHPWKIRIWSLAERSWWT